MLPVSLFLLLVGAWLGWRVVGRVERLLVAHRSVGWCRLVALGGMAYGIPALLGGRLWAAPLVVLAVDAASRAALPLPSLRLHHRRPAPLPTNVIPLRSS